MLSNAYFLAKFRFDTAENEPAKKLQNLLIFPLLYAAAGGHGKVVPERGGPPGPGPPGPGLRDAPPRGRPTGAISVPVTRYPPSPRNGKIHDITNRLTSTFANLNFSKLEN